MPRCLELRCFRLSLFFEKFIRQEILTAVLAYRDMEEDFGPLYAFKECVDSNRVEDEEKDLAI